MGTGSTVKTDLYSLFDYVQNTSILYPKELIIEVLREFFSKDSYYHYVRDVWGHPKTPSELDMALDAGLNDDVTTRLYIGEYFRQDVQFFPALLVKHTGQRSVPLSMSRNKYSVQWDSTLVVDGYGNEAIIQTPAYIEQGGAWEGSFTIEIQARSQRDRDELTELVLLYFTDTGVEDLQNSGLAVKPTGVSVGAASESDDRNDKLFKQTVTLETRTEWYRQIPIRNIIDLIRICIEIGDTNKTPFVPAPGLEIENELSLTQKLLALD